MLGLLSFSIAATWFGSISMRHGGCSGRQWFRFHSMNTFTALFATVRCINKSTQEWGIWMAMMVPTDNSSMLYTRVLVP